MPRELSCHGSPEIHARVDPREGPEGDEGSYLHHCIARRLIDEHGAIAPEGGLPEPKLSKDFKTPKASMWIVDWCIRRVVDTIPGNWALFVELELEHDFPRWTLRGHQDVLAISPDGTQFKGKDWKTGYLGVEPADDNDQVLSYVALDKLAWPSLSFGEFEIDQPRLSEDGDFPRTSVSPFVSGSELDACVADLDRRKCEALDDWTTLVAGPQCKWCVGLSCPCLQDLLEYMKTTLTPELLDRIKRTPDDAMLADLKLTARILAKPLKDLDTMLDARIDKLGTVTATDGTRIYSETVGNGFDVTDPINMLRGLLELMPPDKLAPALTYPTGRLVDAIAEAQNVNKGGAKDITARKIFESKFSPFLEAKTKRVRRYL